MPCAKEGCKGRNGTKEFCPIHRPDADFPECSICLKSIRRYKETLPCSHSFHAGCIGFWLNRAETCPMCRQPVRETDWREPVFDEIRRATEGITGNRIEFQIVIQFDGGDARATS